MTNHLPELYRDRFIIVVDKPSGLPSQAPRGGGENVFAILSERERYVGLHHRLDTPASGALLLSLDERANKGLAEAFRAHTIERTYEVFVVGDPGESGSWREPLDDKPAVTHWSRVEYRRGLSLLRVTLETGRTHQIRRHAAGAGFPIVGDRRYGGAAGRAHRRLALHASRLSLLHPVSGERLEVAAPPHADLARLYTMVGASP